MIKFTRRRAFLVLTLTVTALLLAGVLLPSLSSSDPSLLSRSRKIFGGGVPIGTAHWMSDTELLCITPTVQNRTVSVESWAINAATGEKRRLGSLAQAVPHFGADDCGIVSRDGKWTIFVPFTGNCYLVQKLDGSRCITIPYSLKRTGGQILNYGRTLAWLPDTTGWVELNEEPGRNGLLTIHRFASPKAACIHLGKLIGYETLLGVTRDGHAILRRSTRGDLVSVDVTGGPGAITVLSSQPGFGPQTSVEDAALSPNGERILWQTSDFDGMNILTGLAGLVTHHPTSARTSLWISDLSGKNLHALGHERFDANGNYLHSLRWTPDGRNISFLYDSDHGKSRQLYELPAN